MRIKNGPSAHALGPFHLVGHVGFEPTTLRLKGGCSAPELMAQRNSKPLQEFAATLAGAAGLEPTNAGVKVPCLTNLATPQRKMG